MAGGQREGVGREQVRQVGEGAGEVVVVLILDLGAGDGGHAGEQVRGMAAQCPHCGDREDDTRYYRI